MKQQLFRGVVGLLTLLFATVAFAAPSTNSVVDVQIEPDAVYFIPLEELERGETTLTVSGPEDCYLERDFKEREPGVFKIFDPQGNLVPDGQYKYKVTFRPILSSRDQEILASARKRNDPMEIKELRREGIVRATLADQGYFQVVNGKFVYKTDLEEEGNPTANMVSRALPTTGQGGNDGITGVVLRDFVINDDLIVDGSACIGFDCVNGEVFGFDTIRVKENNLRIKFDDTSVAASFPRNDWQLTANDSANGGASKFSIDDISGNRTPFTVEANARSHSLYVDDGGRIGNRTSTPATEIHTIDGDTPTLRLQQDGSSGFAPQTWDVAGNETNFFLRDVTNGSALPFRIRPGAPTSSIFIDVDGDVGLGSASPDADLHIVRAGTDVVSLLLSQTGGVNWSTRVSGSGRYRITDTDAAGTDDGVNEFEILPNGDAFLAGSITTGGMTCGSGCDLVFSPGYELPSIEEHAASMWQNRHLPEVGPTIENGPINLTDKTGRMLNELEKAHIYIEQMHRRLAKVEAALAATNPEP